MTGAHKLVYKQALPVDQLIYTEVVGLEICRHSMTPGGRISICRRCETFIDSHSIGGYYTCRRCDYLTADVSANNWSDALSVENVRQALRPAPSIPKSADDHGPCIAFIYHLRRLTALELLDWSQRRPADATSFLFSTIADARALDQAVSADIYHLKGDLFRWIQVIYALIVVARGQVQESVGIGSLTKNESTLRSKQVANLTNLTKILTRVERNEIEVRLVGTTIQLREKIQDLLGMELIRNNAHATADLDSYRLSSRTITEVQRTVFGIALSDLDRRFPSRGIRVDASGFTSIDHSMLEPNVDSLLRRLQLTESILRWSEYPDFFDICKKRENIRSDAEVVEDASEMLWTMYFPILPIQSDRGRFSVTSQTVAVGPSAVAASSRSHLLDLARREAKKLHPDTYSRVSNLIQDYHSEFEEIISERAITAGTKAVSSVKRVRGAKMTCGEIDVICFMPSSVDRESFVLVVEAKDTDKPLHKGGGIDQVRSAIKSATQQSVRKAEWVRRNLSLVLRQCYSIPDVVGNVRVFPILVTRELTAPTWAKPVPVFTVNEFSTECRRMAESTTFNEWRPDVLKSSIA